MQANPVELHILGEYPFEGNFNWRATGFYINDDGEQLDMTNNVNAYYLTAKYARNAASGAQEEYIEVSVMAPYIATNYNNSEGCHAVN